MRDTFEIYREDPKRLTGAGGTNWGERVSFLKSLRKNVWYVIGEGGRAMCQARTRLAREYPDVEFATRNVDGTYKLYARNPPK